MTLKIGFYIVLLGGRVYQCITCRLRIGWRLGSTSPTCSLGISRLDWDPFVATYNSKLEEILEVLILSYLGIGVNPKYPGIRWQLSGTGHILVARRFDRDPFLIIFLTALFIFFCISGLHVYVLNWLVYVFASLGYVLNWLVYVSA